MRMRKLAPKGVKYLAGQRVCALSVLIKDGSPHIAAMHFSHSMEPFEIYIQTENTSKKCEILSESKATKASITIGFSEKDFRTLQMDGTIKLVMKKGLPRIHKIHYKKNPSAKKWKDDPATVFLVFKPAWWRYTEYEPKFFTLSS